jgi:hypothetical protein
MYLSYSVQFSKTIFFLQLALYTVVFCCHTQATYLVYHLVWILSTTFFKSFKTLSKKGFYLISFSCLRLLATCFILTYKTIAIIIFLPIYLTYFYIALKYSLFLNYHIIDTLGFVISIILIHNIEIMYYLQQKGPD